MTFQNVQILFWVLFVPLLILAIWLASQNWASEAVAVNGLSAALIGVFGILVTLFFSLKADSRQVEFPVEYILHRTTKQPFSCDFFPDASGYADPGFGTGTPSPAFMLVGSAQAADPAFGTRVNDEEAKAFYLDVLFRQMLDRLFFTFSKSWDAQVTRFDVPTARETRYGVKAVRPGVAVQRTRLVEMFPDCRTIASDFLTVLHLPPRTAVRALPPVSARRGFILANPFVTVTISASVFADRRGVGSFRQLCRLEGDGQEYLNPTYLVGVTAEFERLRSGHRDMHLYKRWFETIVAELQELDARRQWQRLKENWTLYYSHRTKSPLQELMEETRKKAEAKQR